MLVAGPWYSSHLGPVNYSIHFDGVSVPTQLVQSGLLRCFSPKHEPGFVTLQVSCNQMLVSNSVIFEYRAHADLSQQTTPDYFAFDGMAIYIYLFLGKQQFLMQFHPIAENLFRTTLLERCDKLNRASASSSSGVSSSTSSELLKQFTVVRIFSFSFAFVITFIDFGFGFSLSGRQR